jgi:histidinol-phosphatase (PHP family)
MYDYHVHTLFSGDSEMNIEEGIQRAIKKGIKELVFTDHAEFNVWRPENNNIEDDMFDVSKYIDTLSKLNMKYKDKINIKIGVEIGLQLEEKERIEKFVQENPFDFIIGSSHTIDRYDLYFRKLYENTTKEEAYIRYFTEVLKIVKNIESYNVYGHLDLVRRYAYSEYEDIELNNEELELVGEILKELIYRGKGIEVNTSGFRYGLGGLNPGINVLKLYNKLGGEIITVGSDAHKKEYIGHKIQDTYEILKDIGYRYITVFDKREPKFIKI